MDEPLDAYSAFLLEIVKECGPLTEDEVNDIAWARLRGRPIVRKVS